MGMYTEFHLTCNLKKDTPELIIKTLKFMIDNEKYKIGKFPDHKLFNLSHKRFTYMLLCESSYFDFETNSSFEFKENTWKLDINCSLKNYQQEIQEFIDWLMPYIDALISEKLGYFRYEEYDEPELIYKTK